METVQTMKENKHHLLRQFDIIPQEKLALPVHIIGCGAIGSFTALALAKMGAEDITVYDMDQVDTVNMNCQFYRFSDIGKKKALALADLVEDFTGVEVLAVPTKVDASFAPRLKGIVILAVDSIDARREIFESIYKLGAGVQWFIDTRMGAEYYEQHCFNPYDEVEASKYRTTFHTDDNQAQAPCTAKSTVYTATLAAGMVSKTVKNILIDADFPRETFWNIKANIEPLLVTVGNDAGSSPQQ